MFNDTADLDDDFDGIYDTGISMMIMMVSGITWRST